MKKYKIQLQYFKKSGKYYTDGEYETEKEFMWEISDEIKEMKATRENLPGIGGTDWIIHVDSKDHPNAYPILIL